MTKEPFTVEMPEKGITALPIQDVIALCMGWKEDMIAQDKWNKIQEDFDLHVLKCPIHQYTIERGQCKSVFGGTAKCPVCGHYMCPNCYSHACDILSRVTGYMQIVSGWNTAKKQEFEDRERYDLK